MIITYFKNRAISYDLGDKLPETRRCKYQQTQAFGLLRRAEIKIHETWLNLTH